MKHLARIWYSPVPAILMMSIAIGAALAKEWALWAFAVVGSWLAGRHLSG